MEQQSGETSSTVKSLLERLKVIETKPREKPRSDSSLLTTGFNMRGLNRGEQVEHDKHTEEDPEFRHEPGPVWSHWSAPSQSRSAFAAIQTDDLQAEFKTIQDAYARLCVSNDLKFTSNRACVKQSSKEMSNLMISTAKYFEMGLKVLTYLIGNNNSHQSKSCIKLDLQFVQLS